MIEAGPDINNEGLVLYYDALNTKSYPGSGTSWTELMGTGKTATLSNTTFSSPGIVFNGTTSTASFNISGIDFSKQQTLVIGLMPNENDANRRNPYGHEYAGYGTITHESFGDFNYYHGNVGGNSSGTGYQGSSSTFTVAQNEKAIICVTRGSSAVKWYKNGIFYTSTVNSYPTAVTATTTANIGSGYAGFYSGNIYFVLIYNKELTASEVSQNFNALRGRYGI